MRVGPRRAAMPGATPAGGTGVEPAGNRAWRRAAGNSSSTSRWRRSATQRTRSSTMPRAVGSSSRLTPRALARQAAVRSSCVVPRPPPTTSRSGSAAREYSRAAVRRSSSSATVRTLVTLTPRALRSALRKAPLVSRVRPSRSSLPLSTTAARGSAPLTGPCSSVGRRSSRRTPGPADDAARVHEVSHARGQGHDHDDTRQHPLDDGGHVGRHVDQIRDLVRGHEHVHHVDDLQDRLELAVAVGRDRDALRHPDDAQYADGDLATDDEYGHPGRDASLAHQGDERGRDEQFVGERVEELPERRDLLAAARHVTVELVGGRRQDEHGGGGDVAVRLGDPREQQHQEHGDEQDPRDGDDIGEVELAAHGSRLPASASTSYPTLPDATARTTWPRRTPAPPSALAPRSISTSSGRPTSACQNAAATSSMTSPSWAARSKASAAGICPGSVAAGVFPYDAQEGTPAAASSASRTKAMSSSSSSSVSPGNPAMKVERTAAPGSAARTRATRSRYRAPSPRRFMRRRTAPEACWRGTSTYGTAWRERASRRASSLPSGCR